MGNDLRIAPGVVFCTLPFCAVFLDSRRSKLFRVALPVAHALVAQGCVPDIDESTKMLPVTGNISPRQSEALIAHLVEAGLLQRVDRTAT